jgi:hypothetical protein
VTRVVRVGDRVRLVGPSWNDRYAGRETVVIEDRGLEILCGERELLILDPHRPLQIRVYESEVAPIAPS